MNPMFGTRLRKREQGATLVLALVILVLIMMLGIVAVGTSNTQFKLAGNIQFDNNALNNAELAITTAEKWLSTGSNYLNPGFDSYSANTSPALYPLGSRAAAVASPLTTTYSSTNAICVDSNTSCASSYTIQLMSQNSTLPNVSLDSDGVCNKVNTYQIFGRGTGGSGASKTLASYYSVKSCNPP